MEYSVEFSNDKGQKLSGIIHAPTEKNLGNTGVVIFNGGIEDRVGTHRLNLKIARVLSDKGHYVLRFDTHGIGFSEGELEPGLDIDNFLKIQNGIFLDDAIVSINFLSKEIQMDRIVLIGSCGGAITALAAAARDKRIESVILIDVPVYLDQIEKNSYLEAKIFVQNIIKKFFSLFTWKKAFLGKLNIVKIIRLIFIYIKGNLRKVIPGQLSDNNHNTIGRPINKKFVQDFLSFISSKRRVFFIMAESNLVGYEFNYKFKSEYLSKVPGSLYKLIYVNQANHVFHSLLAQTTLLNEISNWITECRCNDFIGGV
jgi:alpha/beta superfamily hydrolase